MDDIEWRTIAARLVIVASKAIMEVGNGTGLALALELQDITMDIPDDAFVGLDLS